MDKKSILKCEKTVSKFVGEVSMDEKSISKSGKSILKSGKSIFKFDESISMGARIILKMVIKVFMDEKRYSMFVVPLSKGDKLFSKGRTRCFTNRTYLFAS